MKPELANKLFDTFPKIFKQSGMIGSIDCPDSWYTIISTACYLIQQECDRTGSQVAAVQVKEKYGTLRFYTHNSSPFIDGVLDMAEEMTTLVCASCGTTKDLTPTEGYILYMCNRCQEGA